MVRTPESLSVSLNALAEREEAFAKVLEAHGHPEPRANEPGVETLLRTIVGQQVSVHAARSMWNKLSAKFGQPIDLDAMLAASDEEMREAGMSRQKAGYLRSLAGLVLSGELDLPICPLMMRKRLSSSSRSRASGAGRQKSICCSRKGAATCGPPETSPFR